jgi:hypothetical protein
MKHRKFFLSILIPAIFFTSGFAQTLDFSKATLLFPDKKNTQLAKAVQVLQEEILKHSALQLAITGRMTKTANPVIAVGVEGQLDKFPPTFGNALKNLSATGKDGFKIVQVDPRTILIAGHDERGALYGVGYLLRKSELRTNQMLVPANLEVSSTPKYPIRGHQLGYRPKTNAYDAWTVAQFDRYIRDLAIFGVNSIEILPPRTDDDATSVNMKLPAIKMIAGQSQICKEYGLDVWMWYPNMGTDYSNPDSIKKELDERDHVFSVLPKLDALFVPGGDPGDLEPEQLFNWLSKVAVVLHKHHPNAKIWVSPQVFKPSKEWYSKFFQYVNKKYDWFGGVVYGPWIKLTLQEVRKMTDPSIPIRRYPDITHSLSCQYPVPEWDLAFAMTLGRECINPRPEDEKHIENVFAPLASGSISYSEGDNDDVNKFVWSSQDWDPASPVLENLRDYARFFIGPDYTENVAQGLLAIERNFRGPLLSNDQVQRTFQQWQDMEKTGPESVLANPRFQSGLIRAYYDAYVQRRLIYETSLEQQARNILEDAPKIGSEKAISKARQTLALAHEKPVAQDLKQRCYALADSLFRSFGAQLTVEKHHAMPGRGNFVDNIDIPLNDALWILDQLNEIEKIKSEPERLTAIDRMLHRTDPGPGGFYDNLGSPSGWKHVVTQKTWAEDPGSLESPRVSFGVGLVGEDWVHEIVAKGFKGQTTPLAWMNQVTTLYSTPLEMKYDNLDPNASYTLRIAYTGRFRSKMRLIADGVVIHDYIRMGTQPVYEFTLPKEITQDGKVTLSWDCGDEERGSQVAEVWLIRK